MIYISFTNSSLTAQSAPDESKDFHHILCIALVAIRGFRRSADAMPASAFGFDSLVGTDPLFVFDDEAELSGLNYNQPPSTTIEPTLEGTMAPAQEEPPKKEDPAKSAKEENDDPLDDLSDAFQLLNHGHRDMIATTAFNYYGDRFATGSVDGKIKVYNKNNAGNWVLCDTWGAHNAEVYQVHSPPPTIHIRDYS